MYVAVFATVRHSGGDFALFCPSLPCSALFFFPSLNIQILDLQEMFLVLQSKFSTLARCIFSLFGAFFGTASGFLHHGIGVGSLRIVKATLDLLRFFFVTTHQISPPTRILFPCSNDCYLLFPSPCFRPFRLRTRLFDTN